MIQSPNSVFMSVFLLNSELRSLQIAWSPPFVCSFCFVFNFLFIYSLGLSHHASRCLQIPPIFLSPTKYNLKEEKEEGGKSLVMGTEV